VIVAVANPRLWSRFCAAVGADTLEHDPRFATNSDRLANRAALNDEIRALFEQQTVSAIIDRLTAAGVPCGRVRTIEEVFADPQLAARQMLLDIATSEGVVKVPGNPVKLSEVEPLPPAAPPALGQHTAEIRKALAGGERSGR
jgi:crotonobetainyl-CoA:carnitine CoA-transferase CaiB-like acyl-CoA transferase